MQVPHLGSASVVSQTWCDESHGAQSALDPQRVGQVGTPHAPASEQTWPAGHCALSVQAVQTPPAVQISPAGQSAYDAQPGTQVPASPQMSPLGHSASEVQPGMQVPAAPQMSPLGHWALEVQPGMQVPAAPQMSPLGH